VTDKSRKSDPKQVRSSEANRRANGETPLKSNVIWVDSEYEDEAKVALNEAAKKALKKYLKK